MNLRDKIRRAIKKLRRTAPARIVFTKWPCRWAYGNMPGQFDPPPKGRKGDALGVCVPLRRKFLSLGRGRKFIILIKTGIGEVERLNSLAHEVGHVKDIGNGDPAVYTELYKTNQGEVQAELRAEFFHLEFLIKNGLARLAMSSLKDCIEGKRICQSKETWKEARKTLLGLYRQWKKINGVEP